MLWLCNILAPNEHRLTLDPGLSLLKLPIYTGYLKMWNGIDLTFQPFRKTEINANPAVDDLVLLVERSAWANIEAINLVQGPERQPFCRIAFVSWMKPCGHIENDGHPGHRFTQGIQLSLP